PYARWPLEARYMLMSLYHGHPLMNGYSAIQPHVPDALLSFPDPVSLQTLQDAGVGLVLVHSESLERPLDEAWFQRVTTLLGELPALPRTTIGETIVVSIPPGREKPPLLGRVLEGDALHVESSDPNAQLAVDGDLATHWVGSTSGHDSELRV